MTSSKASLFESNHLDDMIIIWLDETITNPKNLLLSQRKTLLLSYIKSIRSFVNSLECREYVEKMINVRIFFIVSGSLGETIVPIIHDLSQITFIYIFCADINKHQVWTEQFPKIRGVFNDDIPLSNKVKDDVCSLSNVNFPFGLFDSAQQTLQDLTKEQASFMWFQLITEVFLQLPQTPESKVEMIEECRASYKDNEKQLEKIMIFEKIYRASDALNAFRKQDFEIIFKYRYFLVDLFNQLGSLHKEQYQNREGNLIVYRGQMMFRDELMKLKQNLGHLMSINTFLSTSTTSAVVINFSGNGEHQDMGIVSVIFQISIDLAIQCRPFSNIDQLSCIQDEREILFSIGTIFRIESVDLETDTIWLVKLSWTKDVSEKLKEMKQLIGLLDFYRNQNIGDHPSVLTFGLFLSKMGLLREATRFYIYLRKTLPLEHPDRAVLHNNLGEVLRKRNYFNQAWYHFEEALEYCADTLSIYHPFWAILHSNIALLYLTCRRPKQALKCYRCALLTIAKSQDMNDWGTIYMQERLSTVYHGMGSSNYLLQQFQQALEFHQKALEIELRVLPRDHPTLVDSYYDLSKVHLKLNHWTEALENLEESLRIAQQNLLINDRRLVGIHLSIAILAYNINRNKSKTLVHCSHAQQLMDQSTLSPTSYNRMEIYKTLAHLYTHIGLGHLALQMWEQFIKAGKDRLIADSDAINFSDLLSQMNTLELPKQNSDEDSKYMILTANKYSVTTPLSHLETITQCEIADEWRAMGYIQQAIYYYTWLLENFPTLHNSHFTKVHKSRLHNNLAACYQDLDDDQKALKHYQLSFDILSPDDTHTSMEAAIIYYNIALIYTNCNELDEARMHLHKSLLHFSGSTSNQTSPLDVQIYIAFAKTYELSNDWQMARKYYQRTIDQVTQDAPDHPVIDKYKKKLQYVIDKINDST